MAFFSHIAPSQGTILHIPEHCPGYLRSSSGTAVPIPILLTMGTSRLRNFQTTSLKFTNKEIPQKSKGIMMYTEGKNSNPFSENGSNISCHSCAESGDLRELVGLRLRKPSLINNKSIPEGMLPFNYQLDDDSDSDGTKAKMDAFNNEMSKIVGLRDLKKQLQTWAKGMLLDEKRRAMGINLGRRKQPHMAFLGNPGTGKTTVARILGKLLHSVGVLSSSNVIEVRRTDLVGEYLGQTGPKTRKKIEEAMGGILFVDEAYQLARPSGDKFGCEALEEIMSVLEDGNLVLIFAGYTEPMKQVFKSNEGFCRRVANHFQFEDYSSQDLAEILILKMTKQDEKSRLCGFKLDKKCTLDAVVSVMEKNSSEKLRNKLNGGLVDHMLNNARENLDSRLTFSSKGDELFTIRLVDLEAGLEQLSQRVKVE